MADVLVKVSRGGKAVHAVSEGFATSGYVMDDPSSHDDPHVWMDVQAWMKAVESVADALTQYDPDHAADYQANAHAYLEQLKKLDQYSRQSIGSIPARQRVLVTAHDAFRYFGRAYGIEVKGIQGLSTESGSWGARH